MLWTQNNIMTNNDIHEKVWPEKQVRIIKKGPCQPIPYHLSRKRDQQQSIRFTLHKSINTYLHIILSLKVICFVFQVKWMKPFKQREIQSKCDVGTWSNGCSKIPCKIDNRWTNVVRLPDKIEQLSLSLLMNKSLQLSICH